MKPPLHSIEMLRSEHVSILRACEEGKAMAHSLLRREKVPAEALFALTRFFTEYADALEKKYPERTDVSRRPNFLTFQTAEGSVFLRCSGRECISLEGGSSGLFLQWTAKLNWRLIPEAPRQPASSDIKTAHSDTMAMEVDSIAGF